jgi:hypothetical protein
MSTSYITFTNQQNILNILHIMQLDQHLPSSSCRDVQVVSILCQLHKSCVVIVTIAMAWDSLCETGHIRSPLSIPQKKNEWIWSNREMILAGENRRTRRNTCPSATSVTTNPTWTELGANPGLRVEKPATNCLSYDTVQILCATTGILMCYYWYTYWKVKVKLYSRIRTVPDRYLVKKVE